MTLRQRFEYATELRAYAREVDALALADRRDPEAPIVAKVDLAKRMRERAAEVMRHDDPVERGSFSVATVFGNRAKRPAQAVKRAPRRASAAA